jgi:hypothetical protein
LQEQAAPPDVLNPADAGQRSIQGVGSELCLEKQHHQMQQQQQQQQQQSKGRHQMTADEQSM